MRWYNSFSVSPHQLALTPTGAYKTITHSSSNSPYYNTILRKTLKYFIYFHGFKVVAVFCIAIVIKIKFSISLINKAANMVQSFFVDDKTFQTFRSSNGVMLHKGLNIVQICVTTWYIRVEIFFKVRIHSSTSRQQCFFFGHVLSVSSKLFTFFTT